MKKLPTAIICFSHHFGGMEIDTIKLAKKLSANVPITLIAKTNCFIANSKDEYVGYNNIKLETISFHSSISLSIIFGVRRIVLEKGIKNIIFFGASELKSIYFSLLGLDVNLIVRHGTTKSHPKKDWFHRLIYSNVNYHVAITNHLKKNIEYIIPFGPKTRLQLIYPSIELNNSTSITQKSMKPILLHVGRIAKGKGQTDAIEACKILYKNDIDFELYLVGGSTPDYQEEFANFLNSIPFKDKIHIEGHTSDVGSYYNIANIFLFPSHGEGFGNAFIEALSHQLVCLTYLNTSFIEFQSLGFYFDAAENLNIVNLQQKLLDIVTHIDEKLILSRKNTQKIKDIFDISHEIKNYLEILI